MPTILFELSNGRHGADAPLPTLATGATGRHCERSQAIRSTAERKNGLLRRFRLRSLSYGGQVALPYNAFLAGRRLLPVLSFNQMYSEPGGTSRRCSKAVTFFSTSRRRNGLDWVPTGSIAASP